jgi:putative methyltransferase
VFPSDTDLHLDELVNEGKVILQDKASYFSPLALNPREGSVVIDGCAAPGMKTSSLAALLHNTGRLIAIDKDARRLRSLDELQHKFGASNALRFAC